MVVSERLPAYTPSSLRKLPINEFFKLWRRLADYCERDKKNYDKKGNRIIWREATSWY